MTTTATSNVTMIELSRILDPEFNSRLAFTTADQVQKLNELAESMGGKNGPANQLQPIVVEMTEDGGKYLLVAGSRRLRAAALNGWNAIQATVRQQTDAAKRVNDNLVENLRRENLTTFEEARAYAQLRALGRKPADIARETGVSKQKISNYAICFERLAPVIKDDWQAGHEASDMAFLRALAQKDVDAQIAEWNKRCELYRVAQDVLAAEVEDADEEEAGGSEGSGGESRGAKSPPYRVEQARYRGLLRALGAKKGNYAGKALVVAAVKYLVGDADEVPGFIEKKKEEKKDDE